VKKEQSHSPQIGRPRGEAAVSHKAIIDAVYGLLKNMPARDLTMEAVAKQAGVGKPTLYKWWPSKAALIMAMFHERLAAKLESPKSATAEEAIQAKMRRMITEFNGLYGKIVADLIAEGQSDPAILKELYESLIRSRRESLFEDVERGKAAGEFIPEVDPVVLTEMIFGPIYYRYMLRLAPLTQEYGRQLVDQGLLAVRKRKARK
jgi:AcrR family transcriptional regulator